MSIATAIGQNAVEVYEAPDDAVRTDRTLVRFHLDPDFGLTVAFPAGAEEVLDGLAGFSIATALDEPVIKAGPDGEDVPPAFPSFKRYLGLWIPMSSTAEIDLSGIGK